VVARYPGQIFKKRSLIVKLSDIAHSLALEPKTCHDRLQHDVTGAYVSDLLSDVMAHGKDGNIWITLQTHMNIVAVAGLKNLAGIIIVGGRQPQKDILEKAEDENIAILTTPMPSFELAGKLYQMLK
jgi:predicted transcriptional regulator